MDDGSVSFSDYTYKVSSVTFHTQGFTETEHDAMVEWFMARGYRGVVKMKAKGYWYLYVPRVDAEQFVETVRPFIHESMRYKVEDFRGPAG